MESESFVFTTFLIFTGAALLATAALYARQAIIVGYIVLGILLGPSASGLVSDPSLIEQIAHVGIVFLLFLLGLNLHPQRLLEMLREVTVVTVISSCVFGVVGACVAWLFAFTLTEIVVTGAAVMFSSTILGLKLMPTSVLHHRHIGGVVISILLLQDIIAIVVLLLLEAAVEHRGSFEQMVRFAAALPLLVAFAFLVERYVLVKLFARFDQIQEYMFLVSIGWCLGMAEAANAVGLSAEIGAFIAGVAMATSPISLFISESLKPLRDFFLVMFFVALGAGFDMAALDAVWLPGVLLGALLLVIKPPVFALLLRGAGESGPLPWETGIRLGQASEFSLLISYLALDSGVIGQQAAYVIQSATVVTFLGSASWIVLRFPSPIAVSDRLRRD